MRCEWRVAEAAGFISHLAEELSQLFGHADAAFIAGVGGFRSPPPQTSNTDGRERCRIRQRASMRLEIHPQPFHGHASARQRLSGDPATLEEQSQYHVVRAELVPPRTVRVGASDFHRLPCPGGESEP